MAGDLAFMPGGQDRLDVRFGKRRQLTVTWQRTKAPSAQPGQAS